MIDLSGRLDQGFVDALHAIRDAAEGIGIQFLLVGATARDLLLEKAYGIRIGRATLDVDIAVQVASWEEYEHLSTGLQHRAGFERSKSVPHRLQTKSSLLIDFIPFGPIAGTRQEVAWSPDGSWVLNVQGFDIALSNAVEVRLRARPPLSVKVASIPALALLKLISWDSNAERGKDAFDVYIMMAHYMETPNFERLALDARDLASEPTPPLHEIGAELLGRDLAAICDAGLTPKVGAILRRETAAADLHPLVNAMRRAAGPSTNPDEILALLQKLEKGFRLGPEKNTRVGHD